MEIIAKKVGACGALHCPEQRFLPRNVSIEAWAGVEYAFAPNWSVLAEYHYLDLGTKG